MVRLQERHLPRHLSRLMQFVQQARVVCVYTAVYERWRVCGIE
jgi:hypothetical protein